MKVLCKLICCLTDTAMKAEKAVRSPSVPCCCCCGIKCNLDISKCLEHCSSDVHPTDDGVQMAGNVAPATEAMS